MSVRALASPRLRSASAIGLDVGHTGVRAAQVRQLGGRWSLINAVHWPLRRSEDREAGLGGIEKRLATTLSQGVFCGRTLVVGLGVPDLEVHPLELPDQGDDGGRQLEAAARWEIERLSSFEDEPTQTAHWWLPKARSMRTTALGVVVPRRTVDEVWQLCGRSGGDCRRVDALVCALSRGAAIVRPPVPDEVWGVLDLGARSARLMLCVDEVPVMARTIDCGGLAWTRRIAAELNVGEDSAELHKCDYGLRVGGAGSVAAAAEPLTALAGMIYGALSDELDRLTAEIERSYEYVLQCYGGRQAGDLMLAGAGAALRNLDQLLSQRLGIRVARADDYLSQEESKLRIDQIGGRLREPLAAYLAAIGLALAPEDGR